jgi:hypothetical protein
LCGEREAVGLKYVIADKTHSVREEMSYFLYDFPQNAMTFIDDTSEGNSNSLEAMTSKLWSMQPTIDAVR